METAREKVVRILVTLVLLAALVLGAWYLLVVDDSPPQGPEPTIWDEPDPYF